MSGDNSNAMKESRAYERLLCAIIEKKPKNLIDAFLFEYAACDSRYNANLKIDMSFEDYQQNLLILATTDADNYFSHRQGGRSVIVPKNSPLGRKLKKGAFSEEGEA